MVVPIPTLPLLFIDKRDRAAVSSKILNKPPPAPAPFAVEVIEYLLPPVAVELRTMPEPIEFEFSNQIPL